MGKLARAAGLSLSVLTTGLTVAAHSADYYAGKQIDLLIGADVGGGYDIYGRLLGRHLAKYIPGNPAILPRNMPGAGSAIAASQLARTAPKDGTVIGALMPGAIMGRLLDEHASTLFNPTQFLYLGTADNGTRVCMTYETSKTRTYADALAEKTVMAASQAGGATRDYAALHNHATGTKFEIISGYKGTADIMLAMERGEAAGMCGLDYSSLKSEKPDWLRDHKINIIAQDSLEGEPELTKIGVPQIWPYVKDEFDRKAVELVFSQQLFGRPYVLPPGTIPEAVAILRQAFLQTVKDPDYLADAATVRVSISPSPGEKLQEIVTRVHASEQAVIDRAKKLIEP